MVCREYGGDEMVRAVVLACKDCGYHITEGYAIQWLQQYPGNPDRAAIGARLDIDARECFTMGMGIQESSADQPTTGEKFLKEGGRFDFRMEKAVAVATIAFDARDAILEFMEKEERLFKDFEKNVRAVKNSTTTIITNTHFWGSRKRIVYGL